MAYPENSFDCKSCPIFNPRLPNACSLGPTGSIKLLDSVCPLDLGVKEIKERCINYVEEGNKCFAGKEWQGKDLSKRTTCMVETLKNLPFCFGYNPRKS